ncbi:MAG: hypothetical protein ABSB96_00650 [Gaiellaceae bacterium]
MYRLVRKPSPALVVACLALFVALTGTSVAVVNALPKNSVGTKQLKNNAVVSSKVKNGSLKALDFASGQLPKGEKGDTGATGASGANGATGASGANGATNVVVRSQSGSAGVWSFATAQCLAGERATGGGGYFANPGIGSIPALVNSSPNPSTGTPTGWFAAVENLGSGSVQATAYVVCASP